MFVAAIFAPIYFYQSHTTWLKLMYCFIRFIYDDGYAHSTFLQVNYFVSKQVNTERVKHWRNEKAMVW